MKIVYSHPQMAFRKGQIAAAPDEKEMDENCIGGR